jgi:hypothetical protein
MEIDILHTYIHELECAVILAFLSVYIGSNAHISMSNNRHIMVDILIDFYSVNRFFHELNDCTFELDEIDS